MKPNVVSTVVTVAAYLLSALANGGQAPPAGTGAGGKAVIGYYSEYYPGEQAPLRSLSAHADTLTAIAPFAYYLDSQGGVSGTRPGKAVDTAAAKGLKVLALIHNFTRANGFESWTVHKMLGSAASRSRAVGNLLSLVRTRGYHGVNIDFENVPASDRGNYTAFIKELAQSLRPAGYLVTASLPAKTADSRWSSWSGAFDYAALSPWLDQVMLMTYDENASYGQAGPVASLPWVEKVIRYARENIPSRKIIIGLATYGYDWVVGRAGAVGREFPQIQSLAQNLGISPGWDSVQKTPYIRYSKGGQKRIIWYENNWSAGYKLDLVNRYGLGGVAIWRLGGEDPQLWPVIREKLR